MGDRDFKGIWIPKEIWLDTELNALDKIILAEIDSLDMGERGCYASNKHIAEFCQCSETKVSNSVSKLIKLGYLYVQKFDGRQRELKSRLSNFDRQYYRNCKADLQNLQGGLTKNARQSDGNCKAESQNLQESNTDSNTYNKTNNNTKRVNTRTLYEKLISNYNISDFLTPKISEWIIYKVERKESYKEQGMKSLLKQIEKNSLQYGDIAVSDLIDECMANNWKGIIWDRLKNKKPATNNGDRLSVVDSWLEKVEEKDVF